MEGLRHHSTFDLQSVLPTRWHREIVDVANQRLVELESHAVTGSSPLTLPRGPRTEARSHRDVG